MKIDASSLGFLSSAKPLRDRQSGATADAERSEILAQLSGFAPPQRDSGNSGVPLAVSNIQQQVKQSADGLATLVDLRGQQEAIAELAAALPDVTAQRSTYTDLLNELNTEITRVVAALPGSANSSTSYNYVDTDKAFSATVTLPSTAGLNTIAVTSLERGDLDEANLDALALQTIVTNQVASAVNSTNRAASSLSNVTQREDLAIGPDSNTPPSISEAQKLAESIAAKIGEKAANPSSARQLIEASAEGLEPQRVLDLLV